jgi:hypothetical protein
MLLFHAFHSSDYYKPPIFPEYLSSGVGYARWDLALSLIALGYSAFTIRTHIDYGLECDWDGGSQVLITDDLRDYYEDTFEFILLLVRSKTFRAPAGNTFQIINYPGMVLFGHLIQDYSSFTPIIEIETPPPYAWMDSAHKYRYYAHHLELSRDRITDRFNTYKLLYSQSDPSAIITHNSEAKSTHNLFNFTDLMSHLVLDIDGNNVIDFIGINPKSSLNKFPFYVKKGYFDVKFQTWLNSQTMIVKVVGISMRFIKGFSPSFARVFRNRAMYYLDPTFEAISDKEVNGSIIRDSKKIYISVSGHLLNLLLVSQSEFIDFDRYMKTVEANILVATRNKRYLSQFRRHKASNSLSERGWVSYTSLWHSYYDFYFVPGIYIIFARIFGFPINWEAIRILFKFIKSAPIASTKDKKSSIVQEFQKGQGGSDIPTSR